MAFIDRQHTCKYPITKLSFKLNLLFNPLLLFSSQVKGGSAVDGGAGGGGRIVLDVAESYSYNGDYEVSGGVSEAGNCGGRE